MVTTPNDARPLGTRFRGYLPVVVDVETGGFDPERDALLEIAAVLLEQRADGRLVRGTTISTHVQPFPGANIEPRALEVNGIDPDHPFRAALPERAALDLIFKPIRKAMKAEGCQRAVLVGHNAAFDLAFLNAAVRRTGHKRCPFHPFSTLDTVTLSALAFGQTVLARAAQAAGLSWDHGSAHSAVYDAERTADLFCWVVNRWQAAIGVAAAPTDPEATVPPES